jgi:Tol biopolymer transport system component
VTSRGTLHPASSASALRPVRRAAAFLLALLLGGCSDTGNVTIPPNPNAVSWTRLTGASLVLPIFPDWHGDSLALTAIGRDGAYRIAVGQSDGTGIVTIEYPGKAPGKVDARPRWVRSGLVVYESNLDSTFDVWYRDIDTGASWRLTRDRSGDERSPAPRPRAPDVAYVSGSDLLGQLMLISDTTATPLKITPLTKPDLQVGEPDWDPTGNSLCFTAYDPSDGTRHIWKVTLAPGDTIPQQLTTGPFHDQTPRFSPDGSRILFASDRNGRSGVWTVSPAGESAGLKAVAYEDKNAVILTPIWSPDGTEILLSSNGRGGILELWLLSNLGF